MFEYNGKLYNVPPRAMLAEAILKYAFAPVQKEQGGEYQLPQNLKNFFSGKEKKKSCCGDKCC